jgi:hypothetical protein
VRSLRRASRGERTNDKARKKLGEKCEDRGEKERGQWEKGSEKLKSAREGGKHAAKDHSEGRELRDRMWGR